MPALKRTFCGLNPNLLPEESGVVVVREREVRVWMEVV